MLNQVLHALNAGSPVVIALRWPNPRTIRHTALLNKQNPVSNHAVTLVGVDRVDESLPLFARVFHGDPNWATLVPRLPAAGILPDDPKVIERILSVAR